MDEEKEIVDKENVDKEIADQLPSDQPETPETTTDEASVNHSAEPVSQFCVSCGAPIQDGHNYCPVCGQKVGAPLGQKGAGAAKKPIGYIVAICVLAVAVIVLAIVAFTGRSGGGSSASAKGPDFQAIYDEYCESTWAKVGSDGSYLSIDTNPDDEDDTGIAYYAAYVAIQDVNDALGLPESLMEEMSSTTALMGKQSETFSDQKVVVSWSYHPDKGMEVTYKQITN